MLLVSGSEQRLACASEIRVSQRSLPMVDFGSHTVLFSTPAVGESNCARIKRLYADPPLRVLDAYDGSKANQLNDALGIFVSLQPHFNHANAADTPSAASLVYHYTHHVFRNIPILGLTLGSILFPRPDVLAPHDRGVYAKK